MELIVRPTHDMGTDRPFVALLDFPDQAQMVQQRVIAVIARSFREDFAHIADPARRAAAKTRAQTQTEVARRAAIVFDAFREMRHHGYSLQQTLDTLPTALRARLDGVNFTLPDKAHLWSPA